MRRTLHVVYGFLTVFPGIGNFGNLWDRNSLSYAKTSFEDEGWFYLIALNLN